MRPPLPRRRLAATLGRLLRTSVPASLVFGGCEGDYGAIEETVRVRSDQDPYADLIAACRADDLACDPLCEKILVAEGEDPTYVTLEECRFRDLAAGLAEVEMTYSYPPEACGRRPAGWIPTGAAGRGAGAHLARCAELEEVSVFAFLRLARELEEMRAPAALADAARAAADDEVRHAAMMGGLARALGAAPPPVEAPAAAVRSIGAIAEENAAEGCVREAFGALCATWQAVHAADPVIAAASAAVAADEHRHARLARAVDRFLAPRLGRADTRRVADARRAARADLGVPETHPIALRFL